MRAGRRYAGCEIDPEMAAKANDRLSALLPMTLR
jgi:DNA modification methylase